MGFRMLWWSAPEIDEAITTSNFNQSLLITTEFTSTLHFRCAAKFCSIHITRFLSTLGTRLFMRKLYWNYQENNHIRVGFTSTYIHPISWLLVIYWCHALTLTLRSRQDQRWSWNDRMLVSEAATGFLLNRYTFSTCNASRELYIIDTKLL